MKKISLPVLALLTTISLTSCVTTGTNPNGTKSSQNKPNEDIQKTVKTLPESPLKDIISGTLDATAEWTPEQEHHLGHEMAAQLLGSKPLYKNDAAQKYVNQIGLWIALQTDQAQLPWRFGIIDTPNINAFAAPGGYVFITRGLLLRMKNESELAGVLAHEISHVLKKHHVQAMKMQGLGKIAKGVVEAKAGKNQAISNLAKSLYTSGLDKSDEYEADRTGVVLAARAGYSPFGLPSVIQMYASSPQDATFELLFATHPAPTDRLNKLDGLMANQFDNNNGLVKTTRFEKIQKMVAFKEVKNSKKK
jgi:predicted Zn-dependent protease